MASKPRAKASAGFGKGKAGRRPVRPKAGAGVPLLPVVTGVIVGLLTIGLIATIVYLQRPQTNLTPTVAGIPCDHLEHSTIHYHAAVQIMHGGTITNIRDNTGIQTDSAGNITCYYWLHVHATQKNIVHIESPSSLTFTVGQFFDVANQWSNANGYGPIKLDSTHVATFALQPGEKIVTYVDLNDGKGPTVQEGDPRGIVLKNHEVITIEVVPSGESATTPPSFTFPSGL